jgi:starch phosphorylase
MPEALERWPVEMFERLLPRHLQIIYEINHRFLAQVEHRWPGQVGRMQKMSIIEESQPRMVRMANLAIVGSHAVNGVAQLHSDLVRSELVPDFNNFFVSRFSNKTNGVTPRRWLMHINPELCDWIDVRIGRGWRDDFNLIRELERFAGDTTSQKAFLEIKLNNKIKLSNTIHARTGIRVNPDAMFDIQVKRIHEYKRQLLHALGVIDEYLRIKEDGQQSFCPRVHIFAGKAAPGYFLAKLIIKLINNIADVVNNDSAVGDRLKVVFVPDYKVSLAEVIIPAADLSEQISTAGLEASGTSNMKFAMNGALTIGTLDGANVEMLEEAGADNMFIFGLRTDEVRKLKNDGYQPWDWYNGRSRIRRVIDALTSEPFTGSDTGLFMPIRSALLDHGDTYMHLADFESYLETQQKVSAIFGDPSQWSQKAILNVARMSKFSSDRTIQEYAREIWNISSVSPSQTRVR